MEKNIFKIGIVIVIAILLGSLSFLLVFKFVKSTKSTQSESTSEETLLQSQENNQGVVNIIKNAEEFSSKGDYKSAITVIDTGLITYPNSKELTEKKQSYQVAQQEKEKYELDQNKRYQSAQQNQYEAEKKKQEESIQKQQESLEKKKQQESIQKQRELEKEQKQYESMKKEMQQALTTTTRESTKKYTSSGRSPFYGIWCHAAKRKSNAQKEANALRKKGLDAQVFLTTDWSNLNSVPWYVVSAGTYSSKAEAKAALSRVKSVYSDAYVKYSGTWQGDN